MTTFTLSKSLECVLKNGKHFNSVKISFLQRLFKKFAFKISYGKEEGLERQIKVFIFWKHLKKDKFK